MTSSGHFQPKLFNDSMTSWIGCSFHVEPQWILQFPFESMETFIIHKKFWQGVPLAWRITPLTVFSFLMGLFGFLCAYSERERKQSNSIHSFHATCDCMDLYSSFFFLDLKTQCSHDTANNAYPNTVIRCLCLHVNSFVTVLTDGAV